MVFETAAQLEMQVAIGLLQAALGASLESSTSPSQNESKPLFRDRVNSLQSLWADETRKRAAINAETPTHRPHRNSSASTVSDDGSFGAINGVQRSTSNSTTFSRPISLKSSACSSLFPNDCDRKLDQTLLGEGIGLSRPRLSGLRHKHSLSMSSIATGAIPYSMEDNVGEHTNRIRRGESISIPTRMPSFKDDQSVTPNESLDITDLMARHNIWSPPSLAVKTPPSPGGRSNRSRYGSHHTSGSSQTSQHRRLASVSEDEEDAFKTNTLTNLALATV